LNHSLTLLVSHRGDGLRQIVLVLAVVLAAK